MTTADSARDWIDRELWPIPLPYRGKGPTVKKWQTLRIGKADIERYFSGGPQNVGVLLGEPYGASDLDLDSLEAIAAAATLAPETGLKFGRASKPASHLLFWSDPPMRARRYLDPTDKRCLCELRCLKSDGTVGLQTMAPSSIHPEGEAVSFVPGYDRAPATVDGELLARRTAWIAAASLLARHWPAAGQGRHFCELALARVLVRGGWPLSDIETFVVATYHAVRDHDSSKFDRVRASVRSTWEKRNGDAPMLAFATLATKVGDVVAKCATAWLELKPEHARAREQGNRPNEEDRQPPPRAAEEDNAAWPEPLPIGSELPSVASFDSELLLPEALRAFVEDVGERMQVPLDIPGSCLMVAMGGAASRRARIQPKKEDSSWEVTPNLWGGPVAPSGFLKSPTLTAMTAPLTAQEALYRMEHSGEMDAYETEQEQLELRLSAWKEQSKANFKSGKPAPIRPDTSLKSPTLKRLITSDSTFEKLHELMIQNPAGLLVIRDELSGWLSELDREGRQGERGFFLSAWNGDCAYSLDRIGRGSLHCSACCVSMLGGITPGRLRSYLVDALEDGPGNDGLFQRFQLLTWPDPPRNWQYVDRLPKNNQSVTQMFERILKWDVDLPARFRFNAEAQEFFKCWLGDLERKIRSQELHPALVSHLGKFRKTMPALCLLLSAADQLTSQATLNDPPLVELAHAEQGARWCKYLESHAKRIYACVVTPVMQAAADLADKLKAKAIGADGTFAVRDVYRHHWSRLDNPERAIAALDVLESAGWVRRIQNDPAPGRPPNCYRVNPRLHHDAQ